MLICSRGIGLGAEVKFFSLQVKEDGQKSVILIGLETSIPLDLNVSGVSAKPNSLRIQAKTSQLVKIEVDGESRIGSIRFSNPTYGIIAQIKTSREQSMDYSRLLEFLKDAYDLTKCLVDNPEDYLLQAHCSSCGIEAGVLVGLGSLETICSGTLGICTPALPVLFPLIPVTSATCALCLYDIGRVSWDCAKAAVALTSAGHCEFVDCGLSPPKNLRIY